MPKGRKMIGASRRMPYNFTIEKDIMSSFKEHCDGLCINKSAMIQKFIVDYLKSLEK